MASCPDEAWGDPFRGGANGNSVDGAAGAIGLAEAVASLADGGTAIGFFNVGATAAVLPFNEFAPLVLTESCSPQMVTTQDTPQAWQYARACGGQAPPGQCPNAGDVCAPSAPLMERNPPGLTLADAWTYCVRQIPDDAPCPTQYPNRYVFSQSWNDSRMCSPCACSACC